MPSPRKSLIAAAILALCGAGAIVPTLHVTDALAQAAAPTPAPRERPSRIEGRLAFLKTELKITAAQEPQWNALADVMRETDRARRERMQQMRQRMEQARAQQQQPKPPSAVERFEERDRMVDAQAAASKRFLAAFRPLYASLSDEQKQTADELFAARHHGRKFHGRH